PTLAFVYVETMPDLGSCPGGDGADADKICDAATIGPGDGIPEIIVAARNLRVNATNGSIPPVAPVPASGGNPAVVGDNRIGRGYVIDGATRAVLKRIDMPPADRQLQRAGGSNATTGEPNIAPQFARMMMNPSGLPPCEGLRSENNNFGVGPCPDRPRPERIGDVDGGGQPDIVVTARNYRETQASALPGSPCARNVPPAANTNCNNAGKAWVYRGEDIAGTNPSTILETPLYNLQNPKAATTGGGEYGGNVFRLGDITGDQRPEFVIAARTLAYPLNAPDADTFPSVGASFIFNGSTGALLRTNPHPEPQPRAQFPNNFNSGRPTGDLGATDTPDFLQPTPLQNVTSSDDGRVYVFNGDLAAGGGAEQSWQFAQLDDPNPRPGGTFGGSTTGVGDLVPGSAAPANEVMIGANSFDTFTEAAQNTPNQLYIMNAQTQKNLQTVPHPTGERGDGFGVGLTPMGDLNNDGFLDFAASAYLANVTVGSQGRAYIFKSDNSPLASLPQAPAYQVATPRVLVAGRCANDTLGTDRDDKLDGTSAGDRMAGYGGDDVIRAFEGEDCLHGGAGNDRLSAGSGNDRLLGVAGDDRLDGGPSRDALFGGSGRDRLVGGSGRDRLYGGSGNDRLLGRSGADRLFGERGDDRIAAGGGRNRVDAGPGDDVINVRNGERDKVLCGGGRDRVVADRGDRLNGCERISRRARRARR
ncbi:MAG: hypothetical protein M3301_01990, partial [Chloroflexota bacterium]|nr:hypothetical protein [Chloroflexota bacterium]